MKNFKLLLLVIITLVVNGCKKTIIKSETSVNTTSINTGTTGTFEITNSDLVSSTSKLPAGIIDWNTANSISNKLGSGWRLPTGEEWKILIKYKSQITGLTGAYWTSTKNGSDEAYVLVVKDGNLGLTGINSYNRARAIKKK